MEKTNPVIPEMAMIPSVGASLVNVQTGTYGIAVNSLSKYLSSERVRSCLNELQFVDITENSLTVEYQMMSGTLTEEDVRLCEELAHYEINPNRMTIEEARLVHKFATDADSSIVDRKVQAIADSLVKVLNGKKERRDYAFDEEKSNRLMSLIEKAEKYENGEIDFSRGFDHTLYPKLQEHYDLYSNYEDDEDLYSDLRDIVTRGEFEALMDSMTDEELLDGEYIHEDDFWCYGPYTVGDLRLITTFATETWTKITDIRNVDRLESLLDSIINPHDFNIEADLNRNYISRLVLPARRPSIRNMIAILSAFGQDCNSAIFNTTLATDLKEFEPLDQLRKSLQFCSYYASMVCGLTSKYIKDKYNAARPTTTEYYIELLSKSESWSLDQVARFDDDYGAYLVKLDDHLFEAQAAYQDIISMITNINPEDISVAVLQLTSHKQEEVVSYASTATTRG